MKNLIISRIDQVNEDWVTRKVKGVSVTEFVVVKDLHLHVSVSNINVCRYRPISLLTGVKLHNVMHGNCIGRYGCVSRHVKQ